MTPKRAMSGDPRSRSPANATRARRAKRVLFPEAFRPTKTLIRAGKIESIDVDVTGNPKGQRSADLNCSCREFDHPGGWIEKS